MKTSYISILALIFASCSSGVKITESTVKHTAESDINIEEETSEFLETENGRVYVSEDRRLKIESGIRPESGTAPDYFTKWTIVDDAGKKHKKTCDYSPSMSRLRSIKRSDGSTYYLVNCFAKASSIDGYEWLEAYVISGDSIERVNVSDAGSQIDDAAFEVNYCIPQWYYATDGIGYDWIFDYDSSTGNLYEPIVEDDFITDRYIVWHFDGERFVNTGEHPHKNLHESLSEYNRLERYFTTKDYIVRVDLLDDRQLRYASWTKPHTMADCPDLILTGGERQRHKAAPDELKPCDDYRFTSGSYEYIVNYCEVKYSDGAIGEHADYLLVKKNGEVVLKQRKEIP